MTRTAWAAALLGSSILAWSLLSGLHPAARLWSVLLLVPFPALMVWQARELARVAPIPRREAYVSSIAGLWVLCGVTLAIAMWSGFDARDLGMADVVLPRIAVVTGLLTAAAIGVLFLFRAMGVRESAVLRGLLPVTANERALFVLLSLSAGICEELVFRGFLLRALTLATGVTPLALLLSAGAFGVVHAYQQPLGAVRAVVLGMLLSLPVLFGASIVPAIVAHALVDIITGLWLARYLLRPPR